MLRLPVRQTAKEPESCHQSFRRYLDGLAAEDDHLDRQAIAGSRQQQ